MNSVDDPIETANKPAEPRSTPPHSTAVPPTAEERVIALFHEISSALRHLHDRMGTLEERLGGVERNLLDADEISAQADDDDAEPLSAPAASPGIEQTAPPDTEHASPLTPGLALRSDGKVLLSVTYLEGAQLHNRERWEGVILKADEAWDAIDAISEGSDNAASRVAWYIRSHSKNKDKPEGSGGDGQD